MGLIKLTPEELRRQSKVYVDSAREIDTMLKKLNGVQAQISENWEGKAWEKFEIQYQELSNKVVAFSSLLLDIERQLNEVARVVEQTDQEIASKLGFQ
ncbi:MAG: WXG100 family type VII secretion target [Culicoidibacterales bacterium]